MKRCGGLAVLVALLSLTSCTWPEAWINPTRSNVSGGEDQPRRLMVANQNYEVNLLDATTGDRVRKLVPYGENLDVEWDDKRDLAIVARSNGSFVHITNSTIFTVDTFGENRNWLVTVKGEIQDMDLSPNGQKLAATSWKNERRPWLHVIDLLSNERMTWRAGGQHVSWSRDNRHLAFKNFGDAAPQVGLLDTVDGSRRFLGPTSHPRGRYWFPQIFRPDGSLVVGSECCSENGILKDKGRTRYLVVDPETGEVLKKLPNLGHKAFLIDFSAGGTPLYAGDRGCSDHACSYRMYTKQDGKLARLTSYAISADW